MNQFVADFRRLLESKQLRMTKFRLRIAESISSLPPDGIVDRDALAVQLRAEAVPGVTRAAVYRTIELMLDGDLLAFEHDGGVAMIRRV